MRTAACVLLLALSTTALADDKPAKWEYAELMIRTTPARPALKDKDGNEVAAVPSSLTIRWTTGAGEFEVKGWAELAEKLKVPFQNEGSASSQKIQMLNRLGDQGWELIDQQSTPPSMTGAVGPAGGPGGFAGPGGPRGFSPGSASTLLFKRRVL
jgi:hypothetical protein